MQPAQIGRYRIQRVLGSGGMGTVYEGVHEALGRRAAIKVLRVEQALDADVTRRFLDEARAASQVEHPGIVQVYDFGEDPPGVPYLAMEFLKGESLAKRLEHVDRRRDLPKLLRCLQQVAEALAWAHHVGVIHRDMKPENVFIVEDSTSIDGERPKIVDFGLAKLGLQQRAADPTHTGVPMGTPLFMPPEQWLDAKRADDKSDAYSFGVMLYEVISGRLPFVANDAEGLLERHLQEKPRSIQDWAPGLPAPLVQLVHALLAKRQDQRPTMKAVAATLLNVVSKSPDALSKVFPSENEGIEGPLPRESWMDARAKTASAVDAHGRTAAGVDVFAQTAPDGRPRALVRAPKGPNAESAVGAASGVGLSILRALTRRIRAPHEFELPGAGLTPDELRQFETEYQHSLQRADLYLKVKMIAFPIIILVMLDLFINRSYLFVN